MKHKKIIYKSLFASIATLSLSNYANAAPCTADTSVTVSCEDLTLTNTSTPISVSNGATVQNNAGDYAVTFSGTVNSFTNNGTINGVDTGATGVGGTFNFLNGTVIQNGIVNNGTLTSSPYSIYSLNDGNPTVTINGGIKNYGTVNSSDFYINAFSSGVVIINGGILNTGSITSNNRFLGAGSTTTINGGVNNSGTIIAGQTSSNNLFDLNGSTITGGIQNSGTMSSPLRRVFYLSSGSSISGGITNSGTMVGRTSAGTLRDAIYLTGNSTIDFITNTGSIYSNQYGINVASGTISALNNLQGVGNSNGALTYSGALPTNYNIIINSPTQYGQLSGTSVTGSTTFGIYTDSSVSARTYTGVLQGLSSGNLTTTAGTYSGYSWTLVNSSGTIWDLIFTLLGPSTADTQQSLVNTASVLQGTYTLQNSVMVNGFTYDCPVFNKYGICVSAGGRNTTVQAQDINNASGLLIASYRLNKNNSRIGAWVDQNLSVSGPGIVKLGDSTPMIGLFGVWSQRPGGVGAEVKVSAAYGQKDTTITRQIVGTSEAGTGGSQLISQGAQAVAKYGFAVMPDVVVSPYAGVRYTQNNMGSYTEATSSAVTAPLTYSALNIKATTVLAGAEARYRGIPKTTIFASAGVETDTNTSNGSYSATGVSGLTSVNFNPNSVKTRLTATASAYYDILKNQRIGVIGIYRQEPFQAISTTKVMVTYAIAL